jgi:[ribosomal protein S5]-alanine N-acetyltransferase
MGERELTAVDLVTDDLILEPLVAEHAGALYEPLRDERLYSYVPQRPPASREALKDRFGALSWRRSPDGSELWLNWAVKLKRDGYIGWLQATVLGDRADIAYIIFSAFWRKGYGSQACRRLLQHLADDHSVAVACATVDTENAASIHLLESLGFARLLTQPASDMPNRLEHCYEKPL